MGKRERERAGYFTLPFGGMWLLVICFYLASVKYSNEHQKVNYSDFIFETNVFKNDVPFLSNIPPALVVPHFI